jgi:hypothetical protein
MRARISDELGERRVGGILGDHKDHAIGPGDADRHEVLQRHISHVTCQRQNGEQRAAHEQQRVTVLRRAHGIVHADGAAASRLVLDDE